MALNSNQVIEQARILYDFHLAERDVLNVVRRYWKGRQSRPMVIPAAAPREVRVMAQSSRVNIMPIVINSLVQSTYVEGFRSKDTGTDTDVWAAWQANGLDARQSGIHRAAFGYGTSYAIVLPGDPYPVIKGVSPRNLTAVYGEDPDWPMYALERLGNGLYRVLDDEAVYYVSLNNDDPAKPFAHIETREHNTGVTPVVRYMDEYDLDDDDEVDPEDGPFGRDGSGPRPSRGQIAPLMALQDQIDLTTFGLQIAQHYGAFRQRWIIGWTADSEEETLKAAASKVWTFDEDPESMKLGEFEQTEIKGYLESREATLRHAATLSQTPVHELIGTLINMSAEALAAADAGRDRKVDSMETLLGEAHEQTLGLAGRLMGEEVPADAQVVWRDTSARTLAATVDALGKLAQMLGVPPQELWERIPGVTSQDVRRWKATAQGGDSFQALASMLERQATEV